MWNFIIGIFLRKYSVKHSYWRRLMRPLLILLGIGVVVAGFIYASVVFHAATERSQSPHVHAHSTP